MCSSGMIQSPWVWAAVPSWAEILCPAEPSPRRPRQSAAPRQPRESRGGVPGGCPPSGPEYLRQVRHGHDPAGARRASSQAPTLTSLAERYLAEHAAVKKNHVRPERPEQPAPPCPPCAGRAPGPRHHPCRYRPAASRHAGHARRREPGAGAAQQMFTLAETWGLRAQGTHPVKGLQRYPEHQRERHLTLAELARLGAVYSRPPTDATERPSLLALVRLLLLTGARLGEVLAMRWGSSSTGSRASSGSMIPRVAPKRSISHHPPWPSCRAGTPGGPSLVSARQAARPAPGQSAETLAPGLGAQAGLDDVHLHEFRRHTYASMAAVSAGVLPMIGALLGIRTRRRRRAIPI